MKNVIKTTKSMGATVNLQVWLHAGWEDANIAWWTKIHIRIGICQLIEPFSFCHNSLVLHKMSWFFIFFLYPLFILMWSFYFIFISYFPFTRLSSSLICLTLDTTTRSWWATILAFQNTFCSGRLILLDYYCIAYFNTDHICNNNINIIIITWI